MPDCRRLAIRRHRRTLRGATRCFGGQDASAANRSAADGEGARSLRLRRRRTGRGARTSAPPTAALAGKAAEVTARSAEASPGQVEGGAGAGRAKTKTPAVESEMPATAIRGVNQAASDPPPPATSLAARAALMEG